MAMAPSSRSRSPARYAMPRNTGMSVTAVPRSGCFAMSSSGTAMNSPPMMRSLVFRAPRRFSPKYMARIERQRHAPELGRLQVERTQVDPPLRAELGGSFEAGRTAAAR